MPVVEESVPDEPGVGTTIETGTTAASDVGTVASQSKTASIKVTLSAGKTLRLLAEEHFGNREFWIYFYLENKGKISNPNRVPSGAVLVLPDKSAYSIDAANPQSISKAKSLGNKVLKKF